MGANVEATVSLKDIEPPLTVGGSFGFDISRPGSKNFTDENIQISVS